MNLKVLLPYGVFAARTDVLRIVAETSEGSCGLLPQRLDCVAALVPGILTYQCEGEAETYVAIDEGVLIKTGREVRISVRNAVSGADLPGLQEAVARDFVRLDAQGRQLRAQLTRIENGFISRLAAFHNE